jgi:hypothetical protein
MPQDQAKARFLFGASMGGLLICFSLVCAFILNLLVEPLKFVGTHAEFDPVSLVDSVVVITVAVLICWILLYSFRLRRSGIQLIAVAVFVSWIVLVALFYAAESDPSRGFFVDGSGSSATAVLANGADMVFMPLIIPILSILSGLAYSAALSLAQTISGHLRQDHLG